MKRIFMNGRHVQNVVSPQVAGFRIAVAGSSGAGISGCAATYREVRDSNPVGVGEINRIALFFHRSSSGLLSA